MAGKNIKEEPVHVLPKDIDVEAYVSQLGDQDNHSTIPEIIVLEGGLKGTKPAKFIRKAPKPMQPTK